jgi:glycosyltransferase involved in cell wall biosynthesis
VGHENDEKWPKGRLRIMREYGECLEHRRSMVKNLTLAFVSSAYNEEDNLRELHRRCREVHSGLQQTLFGRYSLEFNFLIADNGSIDGTMRIIREISRLDAAVVGISNRRNYGAEASAGNLISLARIYDITVMLCSDLQDPPEVATEMVLTLLERPELDAVLAVKKYERGGPILRTAIQLYYKALGLSSRRQTVPSGFHGFGCYRKEVMKEASRLWQRTDLNVRQSLTNACQSPLMIDYEQATRIMGTSSYKGWGYWQEALRALLSGDAIASRLALSISYASLVVAMMIGTMLVINYSQGNSGYGGGVPTVMGIVLLSFAVQMLMIGILSRQIEGLRMGGLRRRVVSRRISDDT